MAELDAAGKAAAATNVGKYRWVICGLLFAVTAINYVDRQTLALLAPDLQKLFNWNEIDYSNLTLWFQAAYALGYFVFGGFVDRFGARVGYSVAFLIWSVAHMATGLATSLTQFLFARFALGIGESGNFPSGIKAVTDWFPRRERALAIGIFNAGTNVGAIVTPLLIPFIVAPIAMHLPAVFGSGDLPGLGLGWRAAFILVGAAQLLWLIAWLAIYRLPQVHKRVGAAELALIQSDPPDPKVKISWLRLLRYKETWAYAIGKFLIDPVWWMLLFWLPKFFNKTFHLDLKGVALPLVLIYVIADVGSVAGGWMSSAMIHRGVSVNKARKFTLLLCAILVLPIVLAEYQTNPWSAALIFGLVAAAHQAFSANLFTLPSDVFPRYAVGSVIGLGGTAGAVGGMLMSIYVGHVLDARIKMGLSYTPIFITAAGVYLLAVLLIHLLSPRLAEVKIDEIA